MQNRCTLGIMKGERKDTALSNLRKRKKILGEMKDYPSNKHVAAMIQKKGSVLVTLPGLTQTRAYPQALQRVSF